MKKIIIEFYIWLILLKINFLFFKNFEEKFYLVDKIKKIMYFKIN